MAFNTKKYEDKTAEHRFASKPNKSDTKDVRIVINSKSDGDTTFFEIKSTVTLPNGKERNATKTGMIYKGENRDVRVNIWFKSVPGYKKFCTSIDFNIDTLEISDVYFVTE